MTPYIPDSSVAVELGAGDSAMTGAQVDFSVRTYTVKVKGGERKTILQDVHGSARSGEVLAIMGPSGAGKSTLLDTLAGVRPQPTVQMDAEVKIDGLDADRRSRMGTCYVRQTDVLVSSATVREALVTSAFLRLPMRMTRADKIARVEAIIDELGLRECENTLVGDESQGMKGISGGQMRRLSIGIELVKGPRVIFLDEPTSGLDSEIALGIMQMLHNMAESGRTVACTIHQPNSEIVDTFDSFMLLAKGKQCYFGPWETSMSFFAEAGHPCPQFKNPTDHYMRVVCNVDWAESVSAAYAKSEHAASAKNIKALTQPSSTSIPTSFGMAAAVEASCCSGGISGTPPSWFQFCVLSARFYKSMWRHPIAFVGEISQYWFMSVFVAVMYLNMSDTVPDALYDRAASQWFVLVCLGFVPCFTATTMWISEAKVLRRETADGTYNVVTFYVAKVLSIVPFELMFAITSSAIMYFAIGYQQDFAKFVVFALVLFFTMIVSQGFGLMAAALTGDPNGALIIVSLVLLVLLSFTGFLTTKVPVYFAWVKHVSFLNFASSILWLNELSGATFQTEDGNTVNGDDLLEQPEYARLSNGATIGQNFGYLVANLAILHILALVGVILQKNFNRL